MCQSGVNAALIAEPFAIDALHPCQISYLVTTELYLEAIMFALAVGNFSVTSQTFVHQHAQKIAPGSTVFVSHQSFDNPDLPGPHLYALKRTPQVAKSDFQVGPLARFTPRNRLISQFLKHHGVHTMMAEFGTYGVKILPAAKAAGCQFYVHFHGWDASSVLNDPTFVRRYKKMFQIADGFFAPSRFIADKLIKIGCPDDKIWVTPCGIEIADFPYSKGTPGRCLAVGRFIDKKAPHITVEAFAKAAKGNLDAHLDFVGDGPMMDEAKSVAEKFGASDQITFHGEQPHAFVKELIQTCNIFLQHSVTAENGNVEGLPVAILEAMCAGVAVVSTRHSGIPEAVLENETGLLCDEHEVDQMAASIRHLLTDPELTAKLGLAGHERAKSQFDIDLSISILRSKMRL